MDLLLIIISCRGKGNNKACSLQGCYYRSIAIATNCIGDTFGILAQVSYKKYCRYSISDTFSHIFGSIRYQYFCQQVH